MSAQQAQYVDKTEDLADRATFSPFNDHQTTLYISSQTGYLSSSQLNAIANIVNSFYQPQITITANLNIEVSGVLINENLNLVQYLTKHSLTISKEEGVYVTQINHIGNNANQNETELDGYDTIEATLSAGKWTAKKLRGLAALIQLENLSDVHLLNPTTFHFEYKSIGRINVLRHGLEELGFTVKD